MGFGLRKLARQARCPRCGYQLTGLDRRATCPECGTDAIRRHQLRRERELYRNGWLQAYWIIAILSALPIVPLLANLTAGLIWSGVMPWHPDFQTNLHNGPTRFFDMTTMLGLFDLFFTVMAWQFQFVSFWFLVWLKCSARLELRTPVLLWILMAVALLSPFLLWVLVGWAAFD